MKKLKDVNLKDFAILTAVAFAWSKLGLGASAAEFLQTTRIIPGNEILPGAPEDWKATPKDGAYNKQNPLPGYESAGDYGDWLLWAPEGSR